MSQLSSSGLKTKPELQTDKIILKITQDEMAQMALKGVNPQASNAIKIELHEGYMQITVKLW